MKGQRTAVCKGMVGLVIIRPCQKDTCNDCVTLDNGKQKFHASETLDMLKRFAGMCDYKEESDQHCREYEQMTKFWEARKLVVGCIVWVKVTGFPAWPGKIMNRYDHEVMRVVPRNVLGDAGSKLIDSLLIHFFEDQKNPYYWCTRPEQERGQIVPFDSDEGQKILSARDKNDKKLASAVQMADFLFHQGSSNVYRVLDDIDIQTLCEGKGILARAHPGKDHYNRGKICRWIAVHFHLVGKGLGHVVCAKKRHLQPSKVLKRSTKYLYYPIVEIDLTTLGCQFKVVFEPAPQLAGFVTGIKRVR